MAKTPRWQQIETKLRERINTGVYTDVFPSEMSVATEFGVSRGTARAAIRPLREEGLITAGRGKRPQVSQTKSQSRYGSIYSLKEVIEDAGLVSTNRVIYQGAAQNAAAAEHLGLPAESDLFLLERVRLAGATPLAYEEIYLPPGVGEALRPVSFVESALYQHLRERAKVIITGGKEETRAVAASARHARLLGCAEADPLLMIERIGCTRDVPVEYRRTFFVGALFRSSRTFGVGPDLGAPDGGFTLGG